MIEETFDVRGMPLTELEAEVEHLPGDDDAPAHAEGRESLEELMAAEPRSSRRSSWSPRSPRTAGARWGVDGGVHRRSARSAARKRSR